MIVQDGSSTGAISIIENGEKCPLSTEIYQALGNPLVFDIPDAQYSAIPTGLAYFPEGMLVQDGTRTGPISIIQGGEKRLVSPDMYQYLGNPATVTIADGEYQAIPVGLQYFPEGSILQDESSGAVAIIQGGAKRALSNEVQGYLGNPMPTSIADAEFSAIPAGLAYFPDGMIIEDESSGALAIIQGGEAVALQ